LLRKFSFLGFEVAWSPIEDILDGARQGVLVAIERGKLREALVKVVSENSRSTGSEIFGGLLTDSKALYSLPVPQRSAAAATMLIGVD